MPLDEYHTPGIFTMTFPWLLPTPDGDPTAGDRKYSVGIKAAGAHLLKFAEKGADGVPVYRFAADERFTYYISDMIQRHQLNYQAGVFISQTPGTLGCRKFDYYLEGTYVSTKRCSCVVYCATLPL